MNLTPVKGQVVSCPIIDESPLSIECKVTQIVELGSHDMFIAEVVAVNADEAHFDKQTDEFLLANSEMMCYLHGKYYNVGKKIGKFGFAVDGTGKRNK
jgi:flavin reductase (DIM6/NTAB) family NADH-FMN oxidoreductase RutF